MTTDTNHQSFLDHLRESYDAVWFVARWLWNKGLPVLIPVKREAKEHKDWKVYKDNGDIHILTDSGFDVAEVKRRFFDFTGMQDYLDKGYKDIMVCAKHSFDGADPKPVAYFILSHDYKACAIVRVAETRDKWTVRSVKDKRYQGRDAYQDAYFCPLDLVIFKGEKKNDRDNNTL